MNIIQAKGIYKSYGELEVLKGIDLEVKQAELVSIVGASGAGKTTLLHILSSLDKADRGEIFINGEDIALLKKKRLAKFRNENIGFIFQFHHLLPEFNALENVCIPGFLGKRPKAEVEAEASRLLDSLNLGHRKDHRPSALSGGEQQRVAVARALINNPKIVFADEPSGNLDSKNARELHELFFKLRDEMGQSFVIVTHNDELAEMTDRKISISDGHIL